jgi:hypothetical protein
MCSAANSTAWLPSIPMTNFGKGKGKGGGSSTKGRGYAKGGRSDEVELATTTLTIGGKRFHIDVKENSIGRFVKMRETDEKGKKGGGPKKVILPAAGALQFMEALRKMATPDILKVPHRPVQCLALVVGSLWFEGSLHDSTLARQSLLPLMPRGDPVRFIRNTSPSKPKDSISILSKTQGGDPRTSPHLSRECCLDSESSPPGCVTVTLIDLSLSPFL